MWRQRKQRAAVPECLSIKDLKYLLMALWVKHPERKNYSYYKQKNKIPGKEFLKLVGRGKKTCCRNVFDLIGL